MIIKPDSFYLGILFIFEAYCTHVKMHIWHISSEKNGRFGKYFFFFSFRETPVGSSAVLELTSNDGKIAFSLQTCI